jgi:hypothetical protein
MAECSGEPYHKIQTVFKRDPDNRHKTLLLGEYSLPAFEFLQDCEWEFTEKVDGTNIRVITDAICRVEFRGKSDNAQLPPKLLSRLCEVFFDDTLQEQFPDGACLYGEGYGAGIQSGGNYRANQDFVLFDVKVGDWWLRRADVEQVAETLGLECVPLVGTGTLKDMVRIVQEGFTSAWGDFPAEGLVARPTEGLFDRGGHRIITKLKLKDFV